MGALAKRPSDGTSHGADQPYETFGDKIIAVNNVSFSVEGGAEFGFLGSNGTGKPSTFWLLPDRMQAVTMEVGGAIEPVSRMGLELIATTPAPSMEDAFVDLLRDEESKDSSGRRSRR